MYEQIETFNSKPHYWENKSLWSVQNNQSVTDGISKFNFRNKELSIATYDFSALCTNIPENNWKTMWEELINFCFKYGDKQFIAATKFGAKWTGDKNKFRTIFDKASL